MMGPSAVVRIAALFAIGFLPHIVQADSWEPPETRVTTSSSGAYRVTIVPPITDAESTQPGARKRAHARIERRLGGRFALAWEQGLVNRVVPTNALIANDGAYLVTFDNWGSVGMGPDVVVIYRRGGELVRKLSLEQILPAEYVRHLPRGYSSIWWSGKHRLLERDTVLELRANEPNPHTFSAEDVPVARVRLADGSLLPPEGPEWERAMAKVQELEAKRQAKWEEKRREHASLPGDPLPAKPPEDWPDFRDR